ncbi:hypothetical protein BGY98DRAFT_146670 [Russula aff. rugulosa BPL654]|nr:hypothetical protein BGY98DRAFT_146670 [Russula aff. rugulosa BPL654]
MWPCPNLFISRPQRVPDEKVHVRDTRALALLVLPIFLGHQRLLLHLHHHFGIVTQGALVASIILYTLLSISPLIFSNSPYNTPITPSLRAGTIILRIIIRFPLWCLRRIRGQPFELIGLPYYKGILFRKTQFFSIEAETRAEMLEPYAMKWLFTEDDFTDKTWTSSWKVFQDTFLGSYQDGSIG